MFWIGKLLGLFAIGKSFAEAELFKTLLSSLAVVVGFTVIAGVITGTLLLLAFYGIYFWMISSGISVALAIALIVGIMVLIVLGLACTVRCHLKVLYELPQSFRENDPEHPISGFLQSVVHSFVNGYSAGKTKRRRR